MKWTRLGLGALSLVLLTLDGGVDWHESEVRVLFTPDKLIVERMNLAIGSAKETVWVMAYELSDGSLADQLIWAHDRKDVRVIVDGKGALIRGSQVPRLVEAGVPVALDHAHRIFHHKVIVIDGKLTFTGSYNFTGDARKNAENSVEIKSEAVGAAFTDEFTRHEGHAEVQGAP